MILNFPFHPILFALYVVLAVASSDPSTIFFIEGYRSLIVILSATIVFLVGLKYLLRDWNRAGYLTTLLIFLIFIYGHLYRVAKGYSVAGISLGNHAILFSLWSVLLLFAGSNWVWKNAKKPEFITQVFNIVAIASLIVPIRGTISIGFQVYKDPLTQWSRKESNNSIFLKRDYQPDIYYIIVDGYAREDVLLELYQYDNSTFINYLSAQGFYIAKDSISNYMRTAMSLPASLNFEYLDDLASIGQETPNWYPLRGLINNNNARRLLENSGYQFITISSGYFYTEIRDSDHYLSSYKVKINDFEQLLLGVSAFSILADSKYTRIPSFSYKTHRERILFSFDALQNINALITDDSRPKFIFAHILVPHPPFIFDSQGNPNEIKRAYSMGEGTEFGGSFEEYISNYKNQITYTNFLIRETVDAILEKSTRPPIIIIQGDHGPGAYLDWISLENSCIKERFSILNAFYFPDQNYTGLYSSISPVNSFRVIFDTYFGTNLGYLDDRGYFSDIYKPYVFTDITAQSRIPCKLPTLTTNITPY
jgi:hypothetical protein